MNDDDQQQKQPSATTSSTHQIRKKHHEVVSVCGHVESGKTALVGTLLRHLNPSWAARINEECERKIGIENKLSNGLQSEFLLLETFKFLTHAKLRETRTSINEKLTHFETPNISFDVFDLPGNTQYIKNTINGMIGSTTALLVVDAITGKFEEGMQLGMTPGNTRSHLNYAFCYGIKQAVIAVNKMDAIDWLQSRFETIKADLTRFASRVLSVPMAKSLKIIPISSLKNQNITTRLVIDASKDPDPKWKWAAAVDGGDAATPCLLEALLDCAKRNEECNNREMKLGDVQNVNPNLPEQEKEKIAARKLPPLKQDTIPLRILVWRIWQKNNGKRKQQKRQSRSKLIEKLEKEKPHLKIKEVVAVKVVTGIVKIGDILAFEPGQIVRKVVSLMNNNNTERDSSPADDEKDVQYNAQLQSSPASSSSSSSLPQSAHQINGTVHYIDDPNTPTLLAQKSNLVSCQGPCGIAALGLAELSETEKSDYIRKKDEKRKMELEFINDQEGVLSFQGDESSIVQQEKANQKKKAEQEEAARAAAYEADLRIGADLPAINVRRYARNHSVAQARQHIRDRKELNRLFPKHQRRTKKKDPDRTNRKEYSFYRTKPLKESELVSKFSSNIVRGAVGCYWLHADAPKVYHCKRDYFFCQIMCVKHAWGLRDRYCPVFSVGMQHVPCRIEFVYPIDKRTGKRAKNPPSITAEGATAASTTTTTTNSANGGGADDDWLPLPKDYLKAGDLVMAKVTPRYPSKPIVVDPLGSEGRGSNARTMLGRIALRDNRLMVGACAVRSLWMLRKYPFLIRFFGTGKCAEAMQIWQVMVNVTLYLSWQS